MLTRDITKKGGKFSTNETRGISTCEIKRTFKYRSSLPMNFASSELIVIMVMCLETVQKRFGGLVIAYGLRAAHCEYFYNNLAN